jgi:hypothetical protein
MSLPSLRLASLTAPHWRAATAEDSALASLEIVAA